jgi:hypothetical protein
MEKMEIRLYSSVVEFIFGSSTRIVFNDEDQPGLEVGRDKKSRKIVAFVLRILFMEKLLNFFSTLLSFYSKP